MAGVSKVDLWLIGYGPSTPDPGARLARTLKLDPAAAEAMIHAAPIVCRKGMEREFADQLVAELASQGVFAEVRAVAGDANAGGAERGSGKHEAITARPPPMASPAATVPPPADSRQTAPPPPSTAHVSRTEIVEEVLSPARPARPAPRPRPPSTGRTNAVRPQVRRPVAPTEEPAVRPLPTSNENATAWGGGDATSAWGDSTAATGGGEMDDMFSAPQFGDALPGIAPATNNSLWNDAAPAPAPIPAPEAPPPPEAPFVAPPAAAHAPPEPKRSANAPAEFELEANLSGEATGGFALELDLGSESSAGAPEQVAVGEELDLPLDVPAAEDPVLEAKLAAHGASAFEVLTEATQLDEQQRMAEHAALATQRAREAEQARKPKRKARELRFDPDAPEMVPTLSALGIAVVLLGVRLWLGMSAITGFVTMTTLLVDAGLIAFVLVQCLRAYEASQEERIGLGARYGIMVGLALLALATPFIVTTIKGPAVLTGPPELPVRPQGSVDATNPASVARAIAKSVADGDFARYPASRSTVPTKTPSSGFARLLVQTRWATAFAHGHDRREARLERSTKRHFSRA
ncbi:MAG: hypothetical protein R3A78_04405 [Polyangiales bacterium]